MIVSGGGLIATIENARPSASLSLSLTTPFWVFLHVCIGTPTGTWPTVALTTLPVYTICIMILFKYQYAWFTDAKLKPPFLTISINNREGGLFRTSLLRDCIEILSTKVGAGKLMSSTDTILTVSEPLDVAIIKRTIKPHQPNITLMNASFRYEGVRRLTTNCYRDMANLSSHS